MISSLKEIMGYRKKDAFTAFSKYSSLPYKIDVLGDRISIKTKGICYNYIEFWFETVSSPMISEEGKIIFCNVYNKITLIGMLASQDSADKNSKSKLLNYSHLIFTGGHL